MTCKYNLRTLKYFFFNILIQDFCTAHIFNYTGKTNKLENFGFKKLKKVLIPRNFYRVPFSILPVKSSNDYIVVEVLKVETIDFILNYGKLLYLL